MTTSSHASRRIRERGRALNLTAECSVHSVELGVYPLCTRSLTVSQRLLPLQWCHMVAHGNFCALNALDDASHVFVSQHVHDLARRAFGGDQRGWTGEPAGPTVADTKAWLARLKGDSIVDSEMVSHVPRCFARPELFCEWDLARAPRLNCAALPSIAGGRGRRRLCTRRVYFLPSKRPAVLELVAAHANVIRDDPMAAAGLQWTPLTLALQGAEFFCAVREELSRLSLLGRSALQLPHAEAPHFRLDIDGVRRGAAVNYADLFLPLAGATPAAVIFASPADACGLQATLRRARRRSAATTAQILSAHLKTRFASLTQQPEYRRWLLYV